MSVKQCRAQGCINLDSNSEVAEAKARPSGDPDPPVGMEMLPWIARQSLKTALFETAEPLPELAATGLGVRRGVFVTIRGPGEALRGCVGTLVPKQPNLLEETRQMTFAAAFADRRFPPVTWEEYPGLRFEVSVIGALEEVASEEQLDPQRYGVVITAGAGRTGCLLPGLAEVDTVARQLELARIKGGIQNGEPVRLQRFTTTKFEEGRDCRPATGLLEAAWDSIQPADWWTMRADGRVECRLCPRLCKLGEGQRGFCFVRQRRDNRLVLTAYGRSGGWYVDPMEKKPLFHFYPGTRVLSFGSAGCNLGCRGCRSWYPGRRGAFKRQTESASVENIARVARKLGCQAVAFTYNDPVILLEYVRDVAQVCHSLNLQTIAVTAGYLNPRPRAEFFRHLDAVNLDWKGFTEEFYRRFCVGHLTPVLDTLEYVHRETDVWMEVTTVLIPGENDDEKQLHGAAEWFREHLGPDVPWHFTAFRPEFKRHDRPAGTPTALERARAIALSKGLRYVYATKVCGQANSSTYCPQCRRLLIGRDGFEIGAWNLKAGRCRFCGYFVPGQFEDHPEFREARHFPVHL